jgi:O-antigen ligase
LSTVVVWIQWLSKTVAWIIRVLFGFLLMAALCTTMLYFNNTSLSYLPKLLSHLSSKIALSLEDRLPIYNCAFQLTLQKPLLGWGIGRFSPECTNMTNLFLMHSHNIMLQLTSELGLLITSLILGLMGYIFAKAFYTALGQEDNQRKSEFHKDKIIVISILITLIALVLMHLFDLPLLASYRLNYLFWIFLAISYSYKSTIER